MSMQSVVINVYADFPSQKEFATAEARMLSELDYYSPDFWVVHEEPEIGMFRVSGITYLDKSQIDELIRMTHNAEFLYYDGLCENTHIEISVNGKWYGRNEENNSINSNSINSNTINSNINNKKENNNMTTNTTITNTTNKGLNITSIKNPKSTVELARNIKLMGVNSEFITIDGIKCGIVSYNSISDREKAIATIQKIMEETDKHGMALVMEIMDVFMTQAAMNQANCEPEESEEIIVENIPVILNYELKKVFIPGDNYELKEVANISDIQAQMPKEAIKALLIERVKNALK